MNEIVRAIHDASHQGHACKACDTCHLCASLDALKRERDGAIERAKDWQRIANRQSIEINRQSMEIIKLNERVEEAQAQAKAEGDAASSIQKELEEERARVEKLVKAARQNQWWNKALGQ